RSDKSPLSDAAPPRLLAPLAAMLRERSGRLVLSALAMRSVLDGISARLDESRDISRYLIGLLVFLGLLGTFWGLLETMSSIRDVIGGLSVGGGDPVAMFGALKKGLEAPLSGMGTAFSSSLFGLAASLVLGFLDLQSGQAQNQFFNELEEWLSGQTRLSGSLLSAEGADQSVPAYVQALLEQTAESLDNLQRAIGRGEENRTASAAALATLGTQLSTLVDHMRTEQSLMRALAESHMEMKQILAKMADARSAGAGGLDEATRGHIRNLDIQLARLADEARSGRDHLVDQMRAEIKLLARTIAAAAETGGR
ncbi:MAG: flagellar motor protein MotA, partial [Alphaproteobacteria bacterium]|nr:flagellar motor protein MotA [Alphaproteobacteria bacterium]